jgi:CO/xanthine dehydrogenase Mo-binding subunit
MSINAGIRDILKGAVRFIDDLSEPGMLHALTVRSTVPRGRIVSLTVPKLPPEVIAIRAEDIPGANKLQAYYTHMPVLAASEVNYIGEPVLLLAGPDERQLEELSAEVLLEIEELPPKFSFLDHEQSQIGLQRRIERGSPEAAFAEAFQIVEGEYQTGPQEHYYSDPQGAFVTWENETMVIHSSTQWPYHVLKTVSEVLGVPKKGLAVCVPQTGVSLDGKLWFPSLVAAHAALAAQAARKPVKLAYSREEDFRFTTKRSPTHISHRTALDREGNPIAMQIRIHIDTGAYPLLSQEMLDRICIASTGAYRCDNILIEGEAIRTNKPPLGAFAGFGIAHSIFAMELQSSRISEIAQTDPYGWKERNLLTKGDQTSSGIFRRDAPEAFAVLEQVVKRSDFSRKYAAYELLKKRRVTIRTPHTPLRGIGLSIAYQGSGFLGRGEEREAGSVIARLEMDGKLVIKTSAIPTHHETVQIWKQRARRVLGVSAEDVAFEDVDTRHVPNSGPSTLSRNITIVRNMIESACQSIQKRRFRNPLPIEVKRTFRYPKSFTWDPEALTGDGFALLSWAAAAVEVELDPVTLETHVRGIWICIDGGQVVNPEQARNAVETGVAHSIGWTSREFARFRKGRIPDELYASYIVPGSELQYPITIDFLTPDKRAVPKGIGELPQNCIPAAFIAAVSQATGHYFDRVPLTPEMIYSYTEAI